MQVFALGGAPFAGPLIEISKGQRPDVELVRRLRLFRPRRLHPLPMAALRALFLFRSVEHC